MSSGLSSGGSRKQAGRGTSTTSRYSRNSHAHQEHRSNQSGKSLSRRVGAPLPHPGTHATALHTRNIGPINQANLIVGGA